MPTALETSVTSASVTSQIAAIELIEEIEPKIKNGGRLFYIGAGTSGRLGVLDASECPPTYSVPSDWFIGLIAGGDDALRRSIEGAEDDQFQVEKDLEKYNINSNDLLIGISCSGAAKYVISALEYAKKKSAKTVYLITNPAPYLSTSVSYTHLTLPTKRIV